MVPDASGQRAVRQDGPVYEQRLAQVDGGPQQEDAEELEQGHACRGGRGERSGACLCYQTCCVCGAVWRGGSRACHAWGGCDSAAVASLALLATAEWKPSGCARGVQHAVLAL